MLRIVAEKSLAIKGQVRMLSSQKGKVLGLDSINKSTVEAKYAVRGKIPIRADELNLVLHSDHKDELPFDKIIQANIGNPQQLDQKPLTWYRLVLSLIQYPALLEHPEAEKLFPSDTIERAKHLVNSMKSTGAYSNSQGVLEIRQSVADFIGQRDGFPASSNDIYLTNGASSAVLYLLQVMSVDKNSGFLIPIPQYPLYTASIALNNAVPIGYYLDEENSWSTDPQEIKQLVNENLQKGIDLKCLVVINPGNPTGSILSRQDIVDLIDIAQEYGIVLIADEVYQENLFEGKFTSFRKVLCELIEENPEKYNTVQLASLHSISKGISGECGQRGGYMELLGFSEDVRNIIYKLASINLCSAVGGQALVELMINPPKKGDPSYETFKNEGDTIRNDMITRANLLYESFEKMTDVTCNRPMGAMYLFPRLNFTEDKYPKLFEIAQTEGSSIDEIYCLKLLENTGICTVPGSGFGQKPGTYHFRTTFLAPGKSWIDKWTKFHEKFVNEFKRV